MENQREDIVVILAGYRDRMDQFFSSNPGMGSRIARIMLERQRYTFAPDAERAFREMLSRRISQPRFANARSVRNALERARLRQADWLVSGRDGLATRDDLMRIEAEDILKSRWFTEAERTAAAG